MVTRIDWGSMRGEVDRFEQYLREVKQASENTVQSYRRDLMQMITYLEEKEIREAAKVTKTSLHGYILHMEEQGKAATTISRMMAAMKAFFNMNVCRHASGGTRRKSACAESGEKGAGGPGVPIRYQRFWHSHPGRHRRRFGTRRCWLFYMRPESGCQSL